MRWLPVPRKAEVSSERLPFAGCHAIKTPPHWEPAVRPLRALGEAYGGWTAFVEHDTSLPHEAYHLTVGNGRIMIRAESPRAAFYACHTLLQAWDGKALPIMQVDDSPSLAWRGVVEGFYGKPWKHSARLKMLEFLGAHKMNLYLYAPKDDPFHRERWREPYPPEDAQRLRELIQRAHENFIEFVFCISPGLSMVYSDPAEFDRLTAKIDAVRQWGVRSFGLLLDDIPQELQHEADKHTYSSLAHAHAELANRLYHWLKERDAHSWLIVCPTFYHNLGEPPYVRELGERAEKGISIMWTGAKVVSRTITHEDAELFKLAIQRKPFVWDNYPVNDYETSRLLLGPITGRDAETLAHLEALVSNPMNQAEASKIALGTYADLLWNAEAYDPQRSWQASIAHLVGEDALPVMWEFCKQNLWTRHWTEAPPEIERLIEDWQTTGDSEPLRDALTRLATLPRRLRQAVQNPELIEELSPWLLKLEQVSQLALELLDAVEEESLHPRRVLAQLEAIRETNEAVVCDGWIERWIRETVEEFAES
ncbi:MAG: beta-N-acetylglucosaminidase domain-containing protein [Fimbriimonadales bacterium]|nr:beta-N-acetylglucosaminidase domain-containing protein [Fimbriimonadales bacterium]